MIEKKTLETTLGSLTINNQSKFARNINGFKMSPLLQDMVSYVGQLGVYGDGVEVLEKLAGISTSAMQINKITNFYGSVFSTDAELAKPILSVNSPTEKVYIGIDGSMIFTRDDGWKEVKAGRLFKSSDCIRGTDENTGQIRHSHYIAHLGNHTDFCRKMEAVIEQYGLKPNQLIFLSDGATWIKNWIEDAYPQATSILDFYHAKEHLCDFANIAFADNTAKQEWIKTQSSLLLQSKVETVLQNIKEQATFHCQAAADKLIHYYEENIGRMDYAKYQKIGCGMIGSGAIESTHRTLIQQRCKLSGQRWSKKGVQHMLNLKAVCLNEQWGKVVNLIRKAAA